MARGINKVILVGNLGNDPETKYTQGGMAVTKASLATTSVRKDKEGNTQERTEWHRVNFFGKLGEIAGEYLRKGSQVYVEGSIRYDKYTGQDGVERYFTDIIADEMQMLGGRRRRRQRWRWCVASGGGESRPRRVRRSHRVIAPRREPAPAKAQRLRRRFRGRRHSVLMNATPARSSTYCWHFCVERSS